MTLVRKVMIWSSIAEVHGKSRQSTRYPAIPPFQPFFYVYTYILSIRATGKKQTRPDDTFGTQQSSQQRRSIDVAITTGGHGQRLVLLIIATGSHAITLGLLDLGCVRGFSSCLAGQVDGLVFILLALWLITLLIVLFNFRLLLLLFLAVLLGRCIDSL